MAEVSRIVDVQVTLTASPPSQDGSTVPLIVGAAQRFPERVRAYSTLAEMVADGFLVTDAEYLAAAALLSQSPHVVEFKVGRRALVPTMAWTVTPVVANSTDYGLTLGSSTVSFTSDVDATAAEITAGLKAEVDALALPGVVTVAGATTLTVTLAAGAWLRLVPGNINLLGVYQSHADAGVATDLGAILAEDSVWYGFCLTTASRAELAAAAVWASANGRQLVQLVQDTDAATTVPTGATDAIATLKGTANKYSVPIYHEDNGSFADAAWLGLVYSYPAGSVTYALKTLSSVPASTLTSTQLNNLDAKWGNYYTPFGDRNLTYRGVASDGLSADLQRDIDALVARLRSDVLAALTSTPKVPYTDAGISSVKGAALGALRSFEQEQQPGTGAFLVPGSSVVTAPRAADVLPADKTARLLRLTFTAVAQGAVESVPLRGTLTLS